MKPQEQSITKDRLRELPRKTGVYVLRGSPNEDETDKTLYVGKAKDLFSRVSQYFIGESDTRPFVQFIRKQVRDIRYFVVETEQDALLLENELIKRFKPPYNIMLKDDKRYLSLRLDFKHEWPRIDVVRKIYRDGATYLGPFSSATKLRSTLDFMQKTFPLRTCTDHKLYNRSRPCLEYELKRCVAPCVNYVTKEAYADLVRSAVLFLKGENRELESKMETEMARASENENYEEAAVWRDRLESLREVSEGQSVIGQTQIQRGLDQDFVGVARGENRIIVSLLFVRSGIVLDKRDFEFKSSQLDDESFLIEFLDKYYSSDVFVPDEVVVAETPKFDQWAAKLKVLSPRSDEKKGFLNIAQKNAEASLQIKHEKEAGNQKALHHLEKLLELKKLPQTIDCVDISHHGGLETVASVVRFRGGVPEKEFYRKIKIKLGRVDDFSSMKEALDRRYHGVEDLPDLIVIDGGPGQLSAAEKILQEKGMLESVDLVSLAKARDREGVDPLNPQNRERVFKLNQKNPVLLKQNSKEEFLLMQIRDEAHRFAISFHRSRKEKTLSSSVLDSVVGMTPRLKLKLLRRFNSIDEIQAASDFELLKEIPNRVLLGLREVFGKTSESE